MEESFFEQVAFLVGVFQALQRFRIFRCRNPTPRQIHLLSGAAPGRTGPGAAPSNGSNFSAVRLEACATG